MDKLSTDVATSSTEDLLLRAERRGLRLAILCRTAAFALALTWTLSAWVSIGSAPYVWTVVVLVTLTAAGFVAWWLTDPRRDVWWAKYALYALDVFAVCSLFAFFPVSRGADVPQIMAFRAYGIYFLFPFVALASLSLSWRLVAWTGLMGVVGWWVAFLHVASGMDRTLSWGDMPVGGDATAYRDIFLSLDFVGFGNRIQESGLLFIAAVIMAIAVYRARLVFRAQVAAEAERERERDARERIAQTFGRFVPAAVAQDLIDNGSLEPQRTVASVLVLDIAGFTAFAETRDPMEVTGALNEFLTRASRAVAEHRGTVISFTGDGLLATFGTPIELDQPGWAAVQAARLLDGPTVRGEFKIRIGIATGEVATGSIGADDRQAFTVYGRTVNLAARLEAEAKNHPANILVDARTAHSAGDCSPIGQVALRGFAEPVEVLSVDTI